ncbi:type IV pilus assembly protein PilM [Marisediminicola sp. LYQ134]|uniref:type IV pilus assembly protein PilM n=1 Tax=Marisediminicola sp. LYQ134 TaxID=3391061 RepID=UPI003983CA96
MTANVVGIDIGATSVRAVEVKKAGKAKPTIVRQHEMPLPEGSVRRGEVIEASAVTESIKRLWSTGKFSSKNVVIGMGGPRVLSRDLQMPRTPLAQIREALPFHVQDMLPVPVEETLLDFYPISEAQDENGPVVKGLLVAAIKEAVTSNISAVTGAGLTPVGVDLIPFALARSLAPATVSGLSAAVSIGANTTNVIIVLDGVPQFVRIIAAGSDDTTRALASRLEISAPEAEAIKREMGLGAGVVPPERRLALEIVYETVGELLTSIRNTLTFYTNTKPGNPLQRILLSGGGAQMLGLGDALTELASVPVERPDALAGARTDRGAANSGDGMLTAYSLAAGGTA